MTHKKIVQLVMVGRKMMKLETAVLENGRHRLRILSGGRPVARAYYNPDVLSYDDESYRSALLRISRVLKKKIAYVYIVPVTPKPRLRAGSKPIFEPS